jgi:AbrB family looped-hinge helix DNA binding protein
MTTAKKVEATISTKGQLVIPAELRDELGLEPGTKVLLQKVGTKLELEPLRVVREREKETFLAELDVLAREIGEQWSSPLSAAEAVEEQRR